ncbi:hypothetical protein BDV06DRAFT_214644 [Aspergillus oleicola]
MLCSGDLWITQTTELKLNIRISSGADLPPSFVSQLGQVVCRAKMWSVLDLAVAYKSCVHELAQASSTCLLSFGIQKRFGCSTKARGPRIPKILRDVPDAIPPTDLPTARISTIDVQMQYSHNREPRRMRYPPQELHGLCNNTSPLTEFGNWHMDVLGHSQGRNATVEETNDLLMELDIGEPSDGWEGPCASDYGTLFQDALTALVLGVVSRPGRHRRTDGFQSLSRIAPSVFRLGYSEAINQRSRLMPSIAKSLASMLEHIDNQALKDKIDSFKSAHDPILDTPAHENSKNLKSILKARLWIITQKRLYNAPTPKHLKASSNSAIESEPNAHFHLENEDLLTEGLTENTVIFGDGCCTIYSEIDLHSDLDADSNSNEPDLDSELDLHETSERSSSIMMLGDNLTDLSAEMNLEILEDHLQTYTCKFNPPRSFPFSFPEDGSTAFYERAISPGSSMTNSDHDMLDFDSYTPEEFDRPSPLTQTTFSPNPQFHAGPMNKEEEDEDEMLCDEP